MDMPEGSIKHPDRDINLERTGGIWKGTICRVGGSGGPPKGEAPLETVSRRRLTFILVYCTHEVPPTNVSLRKKLGGNWQLEKLDRSKLGGKGGDVLREFGTFWLAFKNGTVLSGRRQKDTDDLTTWLIRKYPDLRKKILERIYGEILESENRDGRWRMIGDESFHMGELRYVWVVVPPGVKLRSRSFDFHAKDDPEDLEGKTRSLLLEMIDKSDPSLPRERRIQIHVFRGGKKQPEEVEYTLGKLPDTIPMVMESIRYHAGANSSGNLKLQILPEGYSTGISEAGRAISSLITAYINSSRVESEPLFEPKPVGNQKYLQKGEHPYMPYPDALGFALHPFQSESLGELRSLLDRRLINWTFEEADSLSNGILGSRNLGSPTRFYSALRNLDSNLIPRNRVLESIIRLHSKNLIDGLGVRDFIEFEKDSRRKINYQFASDLMIEDRGGIQSWIGEVDDGAYEKLFELNLSGLAYANRRSDGESIRQHISENVRILSDENSDIRDERESAFQRLAEAASHKIFDFEMKDFLSLDEVSRRAFGSDTNRNIRSYMRLRLIREAYRLGPEVDQSVIEFQKRFLEEYGDSRDLDYYLEIMTDLIRGSEPSRFLDEALLIYSEYSGIEKFSKRISAWGQATRIKLGAELGRNNRKIPESIIQLIERIPESFSPIPSANSPIVRQLAWGARLCNILNRTKERDRFAEVLRSKAKEFLDGEGEPFRDSLGLTHACHLIEIEERGWGVDTTGERIGEGYLRMVLRESSPTTVRWFESQFKEEDPLNPLNLMHR